MASITVFLNKDGDVETTYQLSLREKDAHSGFVQTWVNGEEKTNILVTGNEASPIEIQTFTILDWGKVKQCLSNAGVASWVIAGISGLCSAACAATPGLGCIGCIAAAATITGATAGSCVGQGLSNG